MAEAHSVPAVRHAGPDDFAGLRRIEFEADRRFASVGIGPFANDEVEDHFGTISASFGAGGSTVGPAVAEQLGLPFLDRAIPVAVARALVVPVAAALEQDERRPSFIQRVITGMAAAGTPPTSGDVSSHKMFEQVLPELAAGGGMAAAGNPLGFTTAPTSGVVSRHKMFQLVTEQVLRGLVAGGGGVVVGRAAAVVLAGKPNALHVRLHGPRDARITRVMEYEHTDRESAAKLTDQTDRAWESYVHYFYKTDPREARLYHLMIDTTAIPLDTCTQIIVTAAQGMAAGEERAPGSDTG